MKLTPLDIHHKEFRHALRGYSEEEVDAFLDEVADEFERLFKENIDLSEKLEAANARVREYQSMEVTLNNTMVAAQRSAEDIVGKANEEATTMLRDAEVKAKEVIHNALTDKQKVQGELVRIKQAEEEFRGRFRALLEQSLRSIEEIPLPADVTVMMGQTAEGTVADIAVTPPAEGFTEIPSTMPTAAGADSDLFGALGADSEAEATTFGAEAVTADESREPAAATEAFVTSVGLGEIDSPELEPEQPTLEEPREFDVGSFDAFGEREDDIDIEEID